jgi:hypothetical protein
VSPQTSLCFVYHATGILTAERLKAVLLYLGHIAVSTHFGIASVLPFLTTLCQASRLQRRATIVI